MQAGPASLSGTKCERSFALEKLWRFVQREPARGLEKVQHW